MGDIGKMGNSIVMINDGPSMEDCVLDHSFKISDGFEIQIGKDQKNQFFACLEWKNIGPFSSREKTLEAICKLYYEELEDSQNRFSKIERIAGGCLDWEEI